MLRRILGARATLSAMSDRYDVVISSVAMADANTQYQLVVPKDAREVALRLGDATKAWRLSVTSGVVAGGGGFPYAAGEGVNFVETLAQTTFYFACGTAAQTLHYSYLVPHRSRLS